jgi:hypothetical protein
MVIVSCTDEAPLYPHERYPPYPAPGGGIIQDGRGAYDDPNRDLIRRSRDYDGYDHLGRVWIHMMAMIVIVSAWRRIRME